MVLRRPHPTDAHPLYAATHGSPDAEETWRFVSYGPWADAGAMAGWISGLLESADPRWYTVEASVGGLAGMAAFLNHEPDDRRIEIGHIWYTPAWRRTSANSEVVLLMGSHAFEAMHCHRLEWKCDAENAGSRAAAERLGFTFEGVFRRHMIVRGRNRDTAWYSIVDEEWPAVAAALRRWLYAEPRDPAGRPRRSLVEVRASLASGE
jgi:RimJ/RimL family protein N-acetyltransferase